jgi:hypothetical protein
MILFHESPSTTFSSLHLLCSPFSARAMILAFHHGNDRVVVAFIHQSSFNWGPRNREVQHGNV